MKIQSRLRVMMVLVLVCLVPGIAAAAASEAELKASFEALEKDLDGVSDSAMALFKAAEEAFQQKVDGVSEDLDAKADDLEKRLASLSGASKEKIHEVIEGLKAEACLQCGFRNNLIGFIWDNSIDRFPFRNEVPV